jgi:hypothetical protein
MHKSFLPAYLCIIILIFSDQFMAKVSGQNALVRDENISILTYPYSDPNPIPSVALKGMIAPFYPYFIFDGYSNQGIHRDMSLEKGIHFLNKAEELPAYFVFPYLLEKVVILPQEGAHEGHDIFEAANLKLALDRLEKKKYREVIQFLDDSRNWPENLGAGKPYEPDTRLQDYVSAYCYGHLGNRKRLPNWSMILQLMQMRSGFACF